MYVDGYVIAVPTDKKESYREMATKAAPVFKQHGALRVVECWADDVPPGKLTSFPLAVQCKEEESVVFAWIEWPSRAVRDKGMKDAMETLHQIMDPSDMMFDGKRMIFGGFESIVNE